MSETTEGRGEAVGQAPSVEAFWAEIDRLKAQLTEVTRERDAIQATYDEFCAKFPSKSVMRRQAAMRDPEASLAPLLAVVEAASAFMLKWPDAEKGINGAILIASIHSCPYAGPSLEDELNALRQALSALPADPSAPTAR